MKIGSILLSAGAGMLAGAAVAMIGPRQPGFRKTVTDAADSIETAVKDAKDFIVGM